MNAAGKVDDIASQFTFEDKQHINRDFKTQKSNYSMASHYRLFLNTEEKAKETDSSQNNDEICSFKSPRFKSTHHFRSRVATEEVASPKLPKDTHSGKSESSGSSENFTPHTQKEASPNAASIFLKHDSAAIRNYDSEGDQKHL